LPHRLRTFLLRACRFHAHHQRALRTAGVAIFISPCAYNVLAASGGIKQKASTKT
jgi:hypothetical protein